MPKQTMKISQSAKSKEEGKKALFEFKQERIKSVKATVEKMLPLDELFRLALDSNRQFYEFLSMNEEHRKNIALFSTELQTYFSTSEKNIFLNALKFMTSTKGYSMVAYLSNNPQLVRFFDKALSKLTPVLNAFQEYKENQKSTAVNASIAGTTQEKPTDNFFMKPQLEGSNFMPQTDIFVPRYAAYNNQGQKISEFAMDQSLLSLNLGELTVEPIMDLTKSVFSSRKLVF